jgi:hypothetical protein
VRLAFVLVRFVREAAKPLRLFTRRMMVFRNPAGRARVLSVPGFAKEIPMSDPRFDQARGMPRRDPDLPPPDRDLLETDPHMRDRSTWIMGGLIAAVLVLGIIFYSMSGDSPRTAGTSPPETTGQSERVTPPVNPNATEPQKDPPRAQ